MEKSFGHIPFSNSMKPHDEIGNFHEDPRSIAKSLFENADSYFVASQIILRHNVEHNLVPVVFMNLAFSCELFLKSILFQFKEDNERIREHKLYELYKRIPPTQQDEIKICYDQFPEAKTNFDLLINEVSETFAFARYIHERKGSVLSFELFYLVYAVRDCAKKLYNILISEENRLELEKFEKRKAIDIEPILKFWIYYNENCNCNIENVAKKLVDNLCDSLKNDFDNYSFGEKGEDWVGDLAIILKFTRIGYIYNDEYNNILMTTLKVFKRFGLSYKSIRTNGHYINLQKEI